MAVLFAILSLSVRTAAKPRVPRLPNGFRQTCTPLFCFRFPTARARRAGRLAARSAQVATQVAALLGTLPPRTTVALSRTKKEFYALQPRRVRPPRWAAAVAYARLRYIVLGPAGLTTSEEEQIALLAHEYSHVALGFATDFRDLPAWFVEGFADLQARRTNPLSPYEIQRSVPLETLSDGFPRDGRSASQAYSQSRDFVAFLYHSGSPADFRRLVGLLKRKIPFKKAIETVYGEKLGAIEGRWSRSWRFRKLLVPLITSGVLLWMLATILLIWGFLKKRKKQKARLRSQPDQPTEFSTTDTVWPDEAPLASHPPPTSPRSAPFVWILLSVGLTLILTALLQTIWPDIRLVTLFFLTAIFVSLALLTLHWSHRRGPEAKNRLTDDVSADDYSRNTAGDKHRPEENRDPDASDHSDPPLH
jgi:hypothetical protein